MSFKAFLQEKALVKGAFHRWLGKSEDEPITAADIAKGKAAGGHPEKMAVQAQNFREGVDEARIEKITAGEILDAHGARGKDFHTLSSSQVSGLVDAARKHKYHKSASAPGSRGRMFHKHLHRILGEEILVESPVAGTRIVSKHGVGSTHHAEVRFNKDYNEYSVHHYSHGKHLGEGPVSYHGDDKRDAKETAEHEVKRRNSVTESFSREPHKRGTKVTVNGKRGEISHVQTSDEGEHVYKVTDVDANDPYKQKRLEGGNYIPHNRIKVVKEEVVNESMPIKGHHYHTKSEAELHYIMKDAHAAAQAMQNHDSKAHMKYLDQMNDAHTVLNYRKKGGKRVVDEPAAVHSEETINEVKVGDHVHIGHATKGGAGYRGHVVKINGNEVHIQQHHDRTDPRWGARTWKGHIKNVTVEKSIGEEVMVNEKIVNSKEALEKAIAAAERKAQNAKDAQQRNKESSYLEMLKSALRRIKGKKKLSAKDVGVTSVTSEDTEKQEPSHKEEGKMKRAARFKYKKKFDKQNESTEKVQPLTELSKKVLSSYRTKALSQLKAGKGELKGKDEKRFNGVAKSVKEDLDLIEQWDTYPLEMIYEADQAFHNQDEFTKHARASGHVVRTVLRGANAHIHAKHLGTGKTHGLFDVKKEHGVYSTAPLYVGEEVVNETISKDADASTYVDDFVHSKSKTFRGDSKKQRIKRALGAYYGKKNEEVVIREEMSDAAHELVLHADNHAQLHHSSHQPIIKNLKKKAKAGKYDSEKAKKLWGYHADRAAQSYHKEHGDKSTKWHHMFSTHDRKQAAAHWEEYHRHEVHSE